MKSSMNPTTPSPVINIITSRPEIDGTCPVATLPAKYPASEATTITVPPIVGVPRLVACPAGPSSLISWP